MLIIKPEVNVYDTKYQKQLNEDDVIISYIGDQSTPGIKQIRVDGTGEYFGSEAPILSTYEVYVDVDELKINLEYSEHEYTGQPLMPSITTTLRDENIERIYENYTTYFVTYQNNINVGTGKVIVTGSHAGRKESYFKITEISLDGATISGIKSVTYDKTEHKQEPILTLKGIQLVKNVDYICEYISEDYVNVGTKKIKITGIKNISGTKTVEFQINKVIVTSDSVKTCLLNPEIGENGYSYTGYEVIPDMDVYICSDSGKVKLIKGEDYTISKVTGIDYANVGGDKKQHITFSDNFEGSLDIAHSIYYNLEQAEIHGLDPYYVQNNVDDSYDSEYKPSVEVHVNGKRLEDNQFVKEYKTLEGQIRFKRMIFIKENRNQYSYSSKSAYYFLIDIKSPKTLLIENGVEVTETNNIVTEIDTVGILKRSDLPDKLFSDDKQSNTYSCIVGTTIESLDTNTFRDAKKLVDIDLNYTPNINIPNGCFRGCDALERTWIVSK